MDPPLIPSVMTSQDHSLIVAAASGEDERAEATPPSSGIGLRGLLSLVVGMALVALSIWYVRSDSRYQAAENLSAAARIVLERAAVPVDASQIAEAAARGLTSVLDPYSSFLTPDEYESFTEQTEGEYVGIGAEITARDGAIIVYNVFPLSPAADVFIRPGDRIVAIDGESTAGLLPARVVQRIKGPAGAEVTITVQSPGGAPRTVHLARRTVAVNVFPIVGITRSGVAYIRWTQFTTGSGDRLAALVEDLLVDRPIGIVLDLRGNPGGLLDEAVSAAGVFLPAGTPVCRLVGRNAATTTELVTEAPTSSYQGPLVVIQDASTASASEVLVGAFRDASRSLVIGRRSFGKGWVQTVAPLGSMGALRLSTARYATPGGSMVGDPRLARAQYDSILDGFTPGGTGLDPDVDLPAPLVGPWESEFLKAGLFSDYVAVNADDWSAAGAEDSTYLLDALTRWRDSLGLYPSGPGMMLMSRVKLERDSSNPSPLRDSILSTLVSTMSEDGDLLFRREGRHLLRRLWEERLLSVSDADPGELEAMIEFDTDLAVARDLIEQPERYRLLLENARAGDHANVVSR